MINCRLDQGNAYSDFSPSHVQRMTSMVLNPTHVFTMYCRYKENIDFYGLDLTWSSTHSEYVQF